MLSATPPRFSTEWTAYLCAAVVFAAAAGVTAWLCVDMPSGMDMPMPGGWRMSMAWMTMPGQTRAGAALAFILMWEAMMVAMMLPSALPMLLIYRRAVKFRNEPAVNLATWMLGAGYFLVWLLAGAAAYASGFAIARCAMKWDAVSRAVPVLAGVALIACGIFQLTAWKSACLRHCRDPLGVCAAHLDGGWKSAWVLGLHHGLFCLGCCSALMLVQLILGVMNLAVMAGVAVAIAAEKLLPRWEWVVRLIAVAMMGVGVWFVFRAGLSART
jgi:predicted metal-binding membrane protein